MHRHLTYQDAYKILHEVHRKSRISILKRDGHKCVCCDSDKKLVLAHIVHHRSPYSLKGWKELWVPENGVYITNIKSGDVHFKKELGDKKELSRDFKIVEKGFVPFTKNQLKRKLSIYYTPENLVTFCNNCHLVFQSSCRNKKRKIVKSAVRERLKMLYGTGYKRSLQAKFEPLLGKKRAKLSVENGLWCRSERF